VFSKKFINVMAENDLLNNELALVKETLDLSLIAEKAEKAYASRP
jgi:hypothetical protein